MFRRGLPMQIAIMVACEMAFILFGYDQGVFSGIVGNEDFLTAMHRKLGALAQWLSNRLANPHQILATAY